MFMVGGGSGRVSRGPGAYPGATRFMQQTPVKPRVNWRKSAWEWAAAVFYFVVVILALNGLGIALNWFLY